MSYDGIGLHEMRWDGMGWGLEDGTQIVRDLKLIKTSLDFLPSTVGDFLAGK